MWISENKWVQRIIKEIDDKIPNHDKFIATPGLNKFYGTIFAEELKQANSAIKVDIADFMKKTYFDEKIRNNNSKVTSN